MTIEQLMAMPEAERPTTPAPTGFLDILGRMAELEAELWEVVDPDFLDAYPHLKTRTIGELIGKYGEEETDPAPDTDDELDASPGKQRDLVFFNRKVPEADWNRVQAEDRLDRPQGEPLPDNSPPREKVHAKRTPASWLAELWRIGWEYRYNVRAEQDEYKQTDEPEHSWKPADERLVHHLIALSNEHTRWAGRPMIGRDGWQALACGTWKVSEVDPFLEWLDDLPAWDRIPRLATMFDHSFVLAPDQDPGLLAHAAYSVLGGAIRRSHEPGCQHDETVVLLGPPGTGKSSFWRALLPGEYSDWFCDDISLEHVGAKEAVEPTLGAVLVEHSELAGLRRADIEKFKAYATRREDKVRLAYRRDAKPIKRRWIAVGTSNNVGSAFPADAAAGRRLVPIAVTAGRTAVAKMRKDLQGDYGQQLWAEALFKYRAGDPTWLSDPDLVDAQMEAYEQHRQPEPLEDRLEDLRDHPDLKQYPGREVPYGVILEWLDLGGGGVPTEKDKYQVSNALRHLGWVPGKKGKKGKRTYVIPPPDPATGTPETLDL